MSFTHVAAEGVCMESNFIEEVSQSPIIGSNEQDDEKGITLEQIAQLTNFPEDFIKKELLLGQEEISIKQFREKVLEYLESTMKLLKD